MRKVSQAATSLCLWVSAMVIYSQVAKDVEPKRQRGMCMLQIQSICSTSDL